MGRDAEVAVPYAAGLAATLFTATAQHAQPHSYALAVAVDHVAHWDPSFVWARGAEEDYKHRVMFVPGRGSLN